MNTKEVLDIIDSIKQLGINVAIIQGRPDAEKEFDSITFDSKRGFVVSFMTKYKYGHVKLDILIDVDLLEKSPEEIMEYYKKLEEEKQAERERIRQSALNWRSKFRNFGFFNPMDELNDFGSLPCECKPEWLKHETEIDAYPYGDDIEFDRCTKCGKTHNLKVTN